MKLKRTNQTVSDALQGTTLKLKKAGIDSADLDARLLLAEAAGLTRTQLITLGDQELGQPALLRLEEFVDRRLDHEPAHRIIGRRDFYGREFLLGPETLVPRPDTETLIDCVLQDAKNREGEIKILDLGTGSGIIGITLACELDTAYVTAVDVSEEALAIAATNAEQLNGSERITLLGGSLFQPVTGSYDLVVSNPPYIPSRDLAGLSAEVRLHDPRLALDGGEDGLDFYRIIFRDSGAFLTPDSAVFVEIGHDQSAAVTAIAKGNGYEFVRVHKDLAGHDRVVSARSVA